MPDSVWIEGLLAKVESAYGTDPTPTGAADAVRLSSRLWQTFDVRHEWENDRDSTVSGTLLPVLPAKPQGRTVDFDVEVEPQPKGSAYLAVTELKGLTALFQSAGLSATFATSGIDFTPVSASLQSATLYGYTGGNNYKVVGARSSCRIRGQAGQPLVVGFQGRGLLRTDPAAAAVPSVTYLTDEPPAFVDAVFTVGGWAGDVESFELDFGQELVLRPSGNASDGIAKIGIVRHRPRLRITVESAALATYNPYAISKNRTSQAITATLGSGAGKIFKIQTTTGYLLGNPRHVEVGGFTGYEYEYLLTALAIRFE